jgi:hypothetical protein
MEHLSTNRCFVRGTWRENSYAEECERRNGGSGNSIFISLQKGKLRHLAKDGSAIRYIGVSYCPLTGYNPGFLQISLLDIPTPF